MLVTQKKTGGNLLRISIGPGNTLDDLDHDLESFLSVNRLSLQSGNVCFGKLERIFQSINFSGEFSRIHAKETQKLFDPTKTKCYKLGQQRGKT